MTDAWVATLADWSARWGVLIVTLMALFLVRPPRSAAARLWLARLTLFAGLALPLVPTWWHPPRLSPAAIPPTAEPVTTDPTPPEVTLGSPRIRFADVAPPTFQPAPAPPHVITATPPDPARDEAGPLDWPGIIATLWLIGCMFGLLRIAVGRWWMARVRRDAVPVVGDLLDEFARIRDELVVRRPVVFLASPAVSGPALFGGARPAVVVPPDWAAMSAADRRPALIHELTHVARFDDVAALFERAVVAAFFFHPLVRWLAWRLGREREHRCDAAAVRGGVEPRRLARLLLDGARRPLLAPAAAVRMFHRGSLRGRIHQLTEADMTRWTRPLPAARAALAALLAGGLTAAVGGLTADAAPPKKPDGPKAKAEAAFSGVVTDPDGEPAAGATVILAADAGRGERAVTKADSAGRFAFGRAPRAKTSFPMLKLFAVMDGAGPVAAYASPGRTDDIQLRLTRPAPIRGVVTGPDGKPVAGARIHAGEFRRSKGDASWGYEPVSAVRGTPAEHFYLTKTDDNGAFEFTARPADVELIFRVRADGFAELDTGAGGPANGRLPKAGRAKPVTLKLMPEAVIEGRVTSAVRGLEPGAVTVKLEGGRGLHGFSRTVTPGADGRFTARGLPAGPMRIAVGLPPGAAGTATGVAVRAKAGVTERVALKVIPGVEVTGRVVVAGTGQPVAGVQLATEGLVNPGGFAFGVKRTDTDGRFKLRLPPGEVSVLVWNTPAGLSRPAGSRRRKVVIPGGVEALVLGEPFELIKVVGGLTGRVTDAAGEAVPHVKVSTLMHSSVCGNFESDPVAASWDGKFELKYAANGPLQPGRSVPLRVVTSDGRRYEAAALVQKSGVCEVRLPTLTGVDGPTGVKPGELAGVVVDAAGKPLAGVKVHLWEWVDRPTNYTFSKADGSFRFANAGRYRDVQVLYSKDGYSPVRVIRQQTGVNGLVVAMGRATYFEGTVRGPDGEPAADAVIRAGCGPKRIDGGMMTAAWTTTKADAAGRYRLYVHPDEYAFHVKAAGVGVARFGKTGIAHGQRRKFDIRLKPGVTFRAKVIDTAGKPAAGVRFFDWQQKGVDATSDAGGNLEIREMLPGEFEFSVESDRYARWRSPQTKYRPVEIPSGWRHDFDCLTFDLKHGMGPVTVVVEEAVRVTGRVLDPDGKPVGGATVAAALTGTGNSLTGDTRFGTTTKADGTFALKLPASGAAEYNLVAHDGKYDQWRKWANGILPPMRTEPGQVISGVTLRLTRPAAIRGVVLDGDGNPVAGRRVQVRPSDLRGNRYYDPNTRTGDDGSFELKFVRAGRQTVMVVPCPPGVGGHMKTVTVRPGRIVSGVKLVAATLP